MKQKDKSNSSTALQILNEAVGDLMLLRIQYEKAGVVGLEKQLYDVQLLVYRAMDEIDKLKR